ncbi:MAG: glycoside hydrolase family 20 zincin-like fold domain-containing protein [Spartobacteria bacterium]
MLGTIAIIAAVIPRPVQVNSIADAPATLLNGAKVIAPSAYAAEAALIRDAFQGDGGVTIRLEPATGPVNGFDMGNEGYAILNEPGRGIVVTANTRAGFFYA